MTYTERFINDCNINGIYDYERAIKEDVIEAINNNPEYLDYINEHDEDEAVQYINDELWIDDSVTGNASGSYFCNAYKAGLCLLGNWSIIEEVRQEFDIDLSKGSEYIDVSIRCYLLSNAVYKVVSEMKNEKEDI